MKKVAVALAAVVTAVGVVASAPSASELSTQGAAPIFGVKIPAGYRDWKTIAVAHEAGSINDIRAIVGNDAAIKTYRAGKLPFPDGSIIGVIAWRYTPSQENNKIFGREQSFVPGGPPKLYVQFMVKDSRKYASSGGWGFGGFDKDGKPADEALHKTCFPCHERIKARDLVFTRYAR